MPVTERVNPMSLPFDEAIAYFRQKVSLPTEHWNDLWAGMHARAFVVAGATKDELLSDFRSAIDMAIAEGTTLETFRKDFDSIVQTHGWTYKGGRGWRTRVIYETNLQTAYNAGRYKQQTDPDVQRARPYFQYLHGDSIHPRPLHQSWHGLVLPSNHPWWRTHYTPNGWGCKCRIRSLSARDLARLGKSGPDTPPDDGTYEWTDPQTGEGRTIPNGIDPGWDYNPGEAAWGSPLADKTMSGWAESGEDAWERLTPGDWRSAGRPARVPFDKPAAELGPRSDTKAALVSQIQTTLGGVEHAYEYRVGDFGYNVNVDATALARHLPLDASPYVSLLPEALSDPYEVWLAFERHRQTGEVLIRHRIIKALATGKQGGEWLVAQAVKGQLEAVAVGSAKDASGLDEHRAGNLVWARK